MRTNSSNIGICEGTLHTQTVINNKEVSGWQREGAHELPRGDILDLTPQGW